MSFSHIIELVTDYARSYPLLAAAAGVAALIYIYFKPKQALKFGLFLAFVAAVFYILSYIREGTGSGMAQKESMLYKTERALKE